MGGQADVHVDFENKQKYSLGIFVQFQFAIASLLINKIYSDADGENAPVSPHWLRPGVGIGVVRTMSASWIEMKFVKL